MTKIKTTLEGLIRSVEPSDPAECFDLTEESYVGSEALLAKIDGQYFPVHMCGDTNTGYNWNGCHHGVVTEQTGSGTDGGCRHVKTGERAIAQACLLPCSWVIDTINEPLVLVAEIENSQTGEKQWYIVNVIDGTELQPPSRAPCDTGLCCDVGRRDLQATLGGCSPFAGETVRLQARLGSGLAWDGSIEVGGQTLSIDVACDDLSGTWTLDVACEGASGSLEYKIECKSSSASSATGGTGGDEVEGTFTLSSLSGCGGCVEITGEISTLDTTAADGCKTESKTGKLAIAEACGLSFLEVGDYVIVAEVRKAEPSTGSGSDAEGCEGNTEERNKSQWQIVTACTARDCEPCPPPPPPEESECCDLLPEDIPLTLVGTLRIFSNIDACECIDDIAVSFTLVPGSVPAQWNPDSDFSCAAKPGSGTDDMAAILSPLVGMDVRCSGASSSGSDSNAGTAPGVFYLGRPGCTPISGADGSSSYESTVATCDPVTMTFEGEILDCCGPLSGIGSIGRYVRFEMELVGV